MCSLFRIQFDQAIQHLLSHDLQIWYYIVKVKLSCTVEFGWAQPGGVK